MSKRFMPTSPRCSMQALLIALKGRHCLSVRGGQGRVLAASCLKADAMPTQAVKKSIKTKSAPTTWRSNFEPRKKWSRICMPGLNMRQTTQPELPEPWTILRGANAAAFKPAHHLYAEFVCRICMPNFGSTLCRPFAGYAPRPFSVFRSREIRACARKAVIECRV